MNHSDNFSQLGEQIVQLMEENKVPGVSVGLWHDGEEAATGFGVTNVDNPLPVTDETLFQIGSITKTFTGTAIMRLVETGALNLDDAVRAHVPYFKVADETAASQATIRHLLTHTGGWAGDFFTDTGGGEDAAARYVAGMASLEQLAPIGTLWSYNNAGFTLAGHIIETVTGKDFGLALRDLVLDPLGLSNSYLNPADVMTYRFATGHDASDEGAEVARPWALPRAIYAAGGIICHVKDLLRYARFHLGDGAAEDGTRVLSTESLALMHTPQIDIGGVHQAMALTWFVNQVNGVNTLSHGGGTKGQISHLLLVPEHQFAIAVFTNGDLGGHITRNATRQALKQYLGLEDPEPTPLELSEEELAPYVGTYSRPFADIDLRLTDGRLVAAVIFKGGFPDKDSPPRPAPPPAACAMYDEDRLVVIEGEAKDTRGEFIRRADGNIGWLRLGLRLHNRVD